MIDHLITNSFAGRTKIPLGTTFSLQVEHPWFKPNQLLKTGLLFRFFSFTLKLHHIKLELIIFRSSFATTLIIKADSILWFEHLEIY